MKDMKKNQMKVLAVVCALLALVGMGTAIYAAGFSSTVDSTGHKGVISNWSVAFGDGEFTNGEAVADQTLKINGDTAIAPGDEGSFTIKLQNNSDVPADVYIDLYNLRVGTDTDGYTALVQATHNIKFYKTRTGDAGAYTYADEIAVNETEAGVHDITTTVDAGTAAAASTSESTIYWVWTPSTATEESNGVTISVDNKIAGKTIKLDFTATLKQKLQ